MKYVVSFAFVIHRIVTQLSYLISTISWTASAAPTVIKSLSSDLVAIFNPVLKWKSIPFAEIINIIAC